MELYQTENHYILLDGDHSLWCSRIRGTLEARRGQDLCSAWNPVCIGVVYGIIGKIRIHPDSDCKLLLIKQRAVIGQVARHDIFKIHKLTVLSLSSSDPTDLDLDLCRKHHFGIKKPERITSSDGQQKALQKTWNSIKTAAGTVKPKKREIKDKEKFERRILEELQKMYESDSFFYSKSYDLTNSIQRQHSAMYNPRMPLWKRCEQRFFWNRHLVQELIDMEENLSHHWILPIINGFAQIEPCRMDFEESLQAEGSESIMLMEFGNAKHKDPLPYSFAVISRRSRHRAGTRSKKRGIDETGACANYVETEQIIEFSPHLVSFVQVRGSIPVFWSQSGIKYRPPPRLDCGERENCEAFAKHFDEQLRIYKSVTTISLAELSGKEKILSDAYLNNILELNCPDITYITFDFHEHCRGLKFENVSLLTDGLKGIIKGMHYCWVDNKGMICDQSGVFRVNCVDCLDRTNVVQTAIARVIMETQCRKLGLLPPDENLPPSCRQTFQQLWANNGDAISRQYAGTAALKGDFTRTGERRLTGMMKDGVNSANRYYLRFKDVYRQATFDLTLGQPLSEEVMSLSSMKVEHEEDSNELLEKEENVRLLIEDCKRMLIVEPEECLGGWSLINADPATGEPDRQEMDIILLLSQRAVYVGWYDDEEEMMTKYQRIFLEDIDKIEIGAEPALFKAKNVCMRLCYHHMADEGFFHTFRTPSSRLFNNIIVAVKSQEEAKESLRSVCQSFAAALEITSIKMEIIEKQKLDRKKPQPHPEVFDIHQQQQENSLTSIKIPRDLSSPDFKTFAVIPSPKFLRKLFAESSESQRKDFDEGFIWMRRSSSGASPNASNLDKPESTASKLQEEQKDIVSSQPKTFFGDKLAAMSKFSMINKNNSGLKISVPKLNLQNLNPIKKITLRDASRAAKKLSAYLHITSSGVVKSTGDDDATEDIKREPQQHYSKDDSSTTDPTEILLNRGDEDEVMIGSCGILATSPSQLLLSTLKKEREEKDESRLLNVEVNIKRRIPAIRLQLQSTSDEEGILSESKIKKVSVHRDTSNAQPSPKYSADDIDLKRSESQSEMHKARKQRLSSSLSSLDTSDTELCVIEDDMVFTNQPITIRSSQSEGAIASSSVPQGLSPLKLGVDDKFLTVPNVAMPNTKGSRKFKRLYESLDQHIRSRLGEKDCLTKIIFI